MPTADTVKSPASSLAHLQMDRKRVKKQIALRLRQARREANLSQGELAEKIEASASSVLRWEGEKTLMPVDQLLQVAGALDVGISHFFQDFDSAQAARAAIEGEWILAEESGDRSEMAVRLKDVAEEVDCCRIYVQPLPSDSSPPPTS